MNTDYKTEPNQTDSIGGRIPLSALKAAVTQIGMLTDIKQERIPALRCITISFADTVCTVAHYSIDQCLTKTIETGNPYFGVVALPYNQLTAFLAGADGSEVTLQKTGEENTCRLTAGRFEASIIPIDRLEDLAGGYDDLKPARSIAFGDGVFSHVLELAAPCISKEPTRYYLNGVSLEFLSRRVLAIATDGHRLGVRGYNTPGPLEAWDGSVIVPREAVKAIVKLIAKHQGTADFYENSGGRRLFRFAADGWTIWGKAIDGTFPDWRRVIPNEPNAFAEVNASDLIRFAKVARPAAFGSSAVTMQLMPKPDGLGLLMNHIDSMSQFKTTIAAEFSGKECPHIGLDAAYLSAIAKAVGTPRLRLAFLCSGSPVKISAPDAPDDEFMIIMPRRI